MKAKFTNLVWDIDGTLIDTNGVAARTLVNVIYEITGIKVEIAPGQFSGQTDYEIVLGLINIESSPDNLRLTTKILDLYSKNLLSALNEKKPTILGDVSNSLNELSKMELFNNYIGTGNCKKGAKSKLQASGLNKYFKDSDLFCSTENVFERSSIIENVTNTLNPDQTLIIGDSPNDIIAARQNSLRVLAIATGHHTPTELANFEPDYIFYSHWHFDDLLHVIIN